ncbi:MAG TPA: hypothetical protein VNT79_18260, partial [Phycisphaerae bacterium]|nr:hypothetical protein [Phycisphaerae bacterium]
GDKLKNRHIVRIGELMRFFDLRSRSPEVQKLLSKQERELPQFYRSLTALTIVADMGDPPAQAAAAQYYQYLCAHRLAQGNYEGLVDTCFHLPASADAKSITDPIAARMKALQPKSATDDNAAVEYYKLEDLLNDRVPTVLAAKKRRHEILEHKSEQRRCQETIRLYLRAERNGYIDYRPWAVMILQRDCNATDPPALAKEFEHMFQLIMDQAARQAPLPPGDEEDLKKYVTSCARGVDFYRGKLDQSQTDFANKYTVKEQNDPLHWTPETDQENANAS